METDALLKEFHKNKKHHDFDRKEFKEKLFEGIAHILEVRVANVYSSLAILKHWSA